MPVSAAPTEEQIEVVQNIADALVISDYCPTYEFDAITAVHYLMDHDILDVSADPDLQEVLNAKIASVTWAVKGIEEKLTCVNGDVAYGPEGNKVANLLVTVSAQAISTDTPVEAIQHVAEAAVIAVKCLSLEFDRQAVVRYLASVDVEDISAVPTLQEAFNTKLESVTWATEGLGEGVTCTSGTALYGADGTNVPGLLIEAE